MSHPPLKVVLWSPTEVGERERGKMDESNEPRREKNEDNGGTVHFLQRKKGWRNGRFTRSLARSPPNCRRRRPPPTSGGSLRPPPPPRPPPRPPLRWGGNRSETGKGREKRGGRAREKGERQRGRSSKSTFPSHVREKEREREDAGEMRKGGEKEREREERKREKRGRETARVCERERERSITRSLLKVEVFISTWGCDTHKKRPKKWL